MYSTITGRNFCDEEVPKGKSPQTFYYEQMFKEISTRKCMEQIRKRIRLSSNPDLDVSDLPDKVKKQNGKLITQHVII
jgi:hypothetical protein